MKPSDFPRGSDFLNAHLSKFDIGNHNNEKIINFMKAPKDFLLILGTPGSGKTYFCAALMNALTEQHKHFVFLREKDFFGGLRSSMNQEGTSPEWELEKLGDVPFLILDDVGTSQNTEYQQESLFDLVDRRWTSRLPTVFTSNLFLNDFKEKYHERLYSRLRDVRNTIIELKAYDRRQEER